MGRSEKVKDKLRVLFIIPSLSRAGAETQVVDLLNSLDNNRFNIYLFTFHKNIDLYQKLNHEKIKFYNKPRKYKLDFSIIKNIVRIVDKEKIDIIHCSGFIALLMGWLTEKLSKNSPLIFVAIHTTKHRSIKDEIYEKVIYQWLLRACDHVIFVSKKQAEHWRAKYPFLTFKSVTIILAPAFAKYRATPKPP